VTSPSLPAFRSPLRSPRRSRRSYQFCRRSDRRGGDDSSNEEHDAEEHQQKQEDAHAPTAASACRGAPRSWDGTPRGAARAAAAACPVACRRTRRCDLVALASSLPPIPTRIPMLSPRSASATSHSCSSARREVVVDPASNGTRRGADTLFLARRPPTASSSTRSPWTPPLSWRAPRPSASVGHRTASRPPSPTTGRPTTSAVGSTAAISPAARKRSSAMARAQPSSWQRPGGKLEQRPTGRPDSYMPAHTLELLLALPRRGDSEHHRRHGSPTSCSSTCLHKSAYAFTTGLIADALAEAPAAWIEARGRRGAKLSRCAGGPRWEAGRARPARKQPLAASTLCARLGRQAQAGRRQFSKVFDASMTRRRPRPTSPRGRRDRAHEGRSVVARRKPFANCERGARRRQCGRETVGKV
jgi:hypothetical protein